MLTLNYNPSLYSIILYKGKKHNDSTVNLKPPRGFQKLIIPVKNKIGKPIPNLVEVIFVKPK
jgi:hypothetical protein